MYTHMTECHGNNKGPMSPPQTPTDLSFILNPTESSTKKEETTVRRRPDCGGRRKNPYPMRSPSKQPTKGLPPTPPTTTVYGLYNEDPRGFLERNLKELKFIEDPRPHSPRPILSDEERELEQEQKKLSRRRTKKKRPIPYDKVQRKKKSNSMARVLADRASISVTSSHTLSDHSTNTTSSPQSENGETCNEGITSTSTRESATVRVSKAPAPPAMEWHDLKAAIDNLGLDQVRINVPNHGITWKGSPLNITTLPHYSSMHPSEASVASVLRLTPLQYFNAKYTLVSTANRYVQREQPFRKSDAQKLLHIDVNKASKLWEFFVLAGWIKADERDIMRRK